MFAEFYHLLNFYTKEIKTILEPCIKFMNFKVYKRFFSNIHTPTT